MKEICGRAGLEVVEGKIIHLQVSVPTENIEDWEMFSILSLFSNHFRPSK